MTRKRSNCERVVDGDAAWPVLARIPQTRRRSFLRGGVAAVCVFALPGCGDGLPERVPVSGLVVYRDEPVAGAHVVFTPSNARPASARTDADGRFMLRTFQPADGAVLGTHLVTISKFGGGNPDDPYAPRQSVLPTKYRRTSTSGLLAEVTADGKNDFTFELHDPQAAR